MMKIIISLIIGFVALTQGVFCQNQPFNAKRTIEHYFYNKPYESLEKGVFKTSKKHAIYAYNIANMSTVGFNPILLPEDHQQLQGLLTGGEEIDKKVIFEYMMTKMTENSKKYGAMVTMWKGKYDSLRRIVTLGK